MQHLPILYIEAKRALKRKSRKDTHPAIKQLGMVLA